MKAHRAALLGLGLATLISGPALADGYNKCTTVPKASWKPQADAEALAKAAGRSLGAITTIVEGGAVGGPQPMYRAEAQATDASTPIVPGEQETSATVSVTFSLR